MRGVLRRPQAIRAYFQQCPTRKLQIGAGGNFLEGWLNTDYLPKSGRYVFLDATKPFPFADSSFDYVFSEHIIEHIPYQAGCFMLRECRRVLKPGGRVRIATPDLATLLALYTPEKSDIQERYIRWVVDRFLPEVEVYSAAFVINNAFRNWEHQFLYDQETLQRAMQEAGFVEVARYAPGESDDPILRGLEAHGRATGSEEINRFETMVLEGKRGVDTDETRSPETCVEGASAAWHNRQ